MSAQNTSDEGADGGTVTTNPEGAEANELLQYILTGRARLVTIFVVVEAILMLWAVFWEFVIGNSIVAALAAASALLFLIIAVAILVVWGIAKVVRSIR